MGAITYLLGGVVQPFLLYMLWACMLEPRWKKRPFWMYAILATLVVQIPTLIRGMVEGVLYDIMAYAQLIVLICFALLLFADKFWIKIFVVFLYYLSALVAEVIAFTLLGDDMVGVDPYGDTLEALIINMLAMIILFSMLGIIAILWNLILKKRFIPQNVFLFLMFPIGQICMLDIWSQQLQKGDMQFQSQLNVFVGLFIGFLADAILFYVMFMQGEKEEMKLHLAETEHAMELGWKYYQSVKERQEEMAKIRHDFNNQLTTALRIAETGEKEKAKELLKDLNEIVMQNTSLKYCENSIVNAVIAEKQAFCKKDNIRLNIDVELEETIEIKGVHLCSLTANLLDNAMYAAMCSGVAEPYVKIAIQRKESYLYIKVENAARKPEKKEPRDGHGYGLGIIENITKQYNGEYQAGWKDGEYSTLVVLELIK